MAACQSHLGPINYTISLPYFSDLVLKVDQCRTSRLTDTLGGGSQSAVIPRSAIAPALSAKILYHEGLRLLWQSQLKP